MYLTHLFIENIGPISNIELKLPFNDDGTPKPLIFVGENGSGKTMLLSCIVDSFYEIANILFEDVLPKIGLGYQYYKILGGTNIKSGSEYGLFGLKYEAEGINPLFYLDSEGSSIAFDNLKKFLPDFPATENNKNKKIINPPNFNEKKKENLQEIFNKTAMFYLPAYRHETPFWKNPTVESQGDTLKDSTLYKNKYGKDIEIVKSLDDNKSYLLDLILDYIANSPRIDTDEIVAMDMIKLNNINQIIQKIKGQDNIQFNIGRRGNYRMGISETDKNSRKSSLIISTIDALSLGETSILNMFLNIIRYTDKSNKSLSEIKGIVLIDEIDAHLHIKLLEYVLPNLIKLFPMVQFIITSQSPFFLLGMKTVFGDDKFEVREMPSGKLISVDSFSELQNGLNAIKKTKQFEDELGKIIKENDKLPILFVEGKTDKIILENAWKKLFPGEKIGFKIENAFDCFFIQNTFMRGELFINNPDSTFIGMLDFDKAYENYKRIKDKKDDYEEIDDDEQNGLTLKHKNFNGYIFLLPIPLNRKDMAGKKFEENSLLSIEFLFDETKIENFIEKKPIPGGEKRIIKENKKIEFAKLTESFSKEDFLNFEKIFLKINNIIESSNSSTN
jgi:predicted ATP-binding protein involved in virulence